MKFTVESTRANFSTKHEMKVQQSGVTPNSKEKKQKKSSTKLQEYFNVPR